MSALRKLLDPVTQSLSSLLHNGSDLSDIVMPPFEAIAELERRQKDTELRKRVEEYLQGDIPDYFKNGPISYLARHVVTPNFETLRFIHLVDHLGLKAVVSYDSKSIFVSQNQDKRALCKLSVCRRITQKNGKLNEQYQNATIVDFNKVDGKKFSEIKTLWGENLIDFHSRLFSELGMKKSETPDDAAWIDRHHRDDLLKLYKDFLALFLVHGIFFDNYNARDKYESLFIRDILRPACQFIQEYFKYKPLITSIFPNSFESYRFWISYPSQILDALEKDIHSLDLQKGKTRLP